MRGGGAAARILGWTGGLLLLAWLGGCDDGDEPGGSSGTSSHGSSSGASVADSGDGDCFAGELGCPCEPGDLCVAGLECVDGTCEEFGDGEEGTTSSGTSGADDTGGGVDTCVENVECFESEICVFETCVPIADFEWQFSVVEFVPGGCRDGWGSAEIFYRYYQDGAQVDESPDVECPAQWPELNQTYTPGAVFDLEFWELDFLFDDFFTRLCWSDPRDESICGPVPDYVLHEGGYYGASNDGVHTFELYFEPVL